MKIRILTSIRRTARILVQALPALLLLFTAARLLLQADQLDRLRDARLLVLQGRSQLAFQQYQQLSTLGEQYPEFFLQFAELRLVRGEALEAERLLLRALRRPLAPTQRAEAQLAYGWALALQGRTDRAVAVWQTLPISLQGKAAVLRGELALLQGHLQEAQTAAQQALAAQLPPKWRALAAYRLALLQGLADPQAARAALLELDPQQGMLVLPPLGSWPTSLWAGRIARLRTALDQSDGERRLALPALLAEEGLLKASYALLIQDTTQPLTNERALLFEARLRWHLGERNRALARLKEAITLYPQSAALLRLLALLQVEQHSPAAVETLALAERLDPVAPDNAVVRAALKRAEHDYEAAAQAYEEAIALAEPEQQALYHLHAARFYHGTTWQQCEAGLTHARQAVAGLDDDAEAWMLLSEMLLRCGQPAEALAAGDQLARRWPDEPAGHFIRGSALLSLNRHDEGREALLLAADLAPTSSWRTRAEVFLSD